MLLTFFFFIFNFINGSKPMIQQNKTYNIKPETMGLHQLNPGLKHKPTNRTAKTRVQQSSHARPRVEITQQPRHASSDPSS